MTQLIPVVSSYSLSLRTPSQTLRTLLKAPRCTVFGTGTAAVSVSALSRHLTQAVTEGLLDEWVPSLDPEEKQNLCAEAAGLWVAEVRVLRWEPSTTVEKMVFGLGLPFDYDTIVSTYL